jgi:hypothetical protein
VISSSFVSNRSNSNQKPICPAPEDRMKSKSVWRVVFVITLALVNGIFGDETKTPVGANPSQKKEESPKKAGQGNKTGPARLFQIDTDKLDVYDKDLKVRLAKKGDWIQCNLVCSTFRNGETIADLKVEIEGCGGEHGGTDHGNS